MRGNMGKKLQEELLRGLMEDTISLERIKDVLAGSISVEPGFAEAVAESNSQQITINTAFLEKVPFAPRRIPEKRK